MTLQTKCNKSTLLLVRVLVIMTLAAACLEFVESVGVHERCLNEFIEARSSLDKQLILAGGKSCHSLQEEKDNQHDIENFPMITAQMLHLIDSAQFEPVCNEFLRTIVKVFQLETVVENHVANWFERNQGKPVKKELDFVMEGIYRPYCMLLTFSSPEQLISDVKSELKKDYEQAIENLSPYL